MNGDMSRVYFAGVGVDKYELPGAARHLPQGREDLLPFALWLRNMGVPAKNISLFTNGDKREFSDKLSECRLECPKADLISGKKKTSSRHP